MGLYSQDLIQTHLSLRCHHSGIKASTFESGEDTNIQPTAASQAVMDTEREINIGYEKP